MTINSVNSFVRKSRYANVLRYQIYDGEQLSVITGFRNTFTSGEVPVYIQHTIQDNETFQDIALKYYGRSDMWYVVADQTAKDVFYPGDVNLYVGTTIRLVPKSYIVGS